MKLGKEFRGFGRYMTLGVQMVVTTAVITLIGYWLDRQTGRSPLFLIVFFVLGSLGGMAFVWRELHTDDRNNRV